MYKKIILSLLMILILSSCSVQIQNEYENSNDTVDYIKSVFITYYELSTLTKDNDESKFTKEIGKVFKSLSSAGYNRVTVHIRPCADAFYNSSYYPVSQYCFGKQGDELIYDPLLIIVQQAHKYDLSVEAWINPYRVSQNDNFDELSSDNKALEWKDTDKVFCYDGAIYFNPADEDVNNLIVNGVREIAENYDVESICFDDYFYPTKDESIDKSYYEDYVNNNGELSLAKWRRQNVSNMVKSVYSAIKEIDKTITFGISPASDIDNDYSSLYADVELWSNNEGYVDYICPQIYFGFLNENQPFMQTTKDWLYMVNSDVCELYVALAAYKTGKEDKYAGDSGTNEFVDNDDIIEREINYLSKIEDVKGYYMFSYSYLDIQ